MDVTWSHGPVDRIDQEPQLPFRLGRTEHEGQTEKGAVGRKTVRGGKSQKGEAPQKNQRLRAGGRRVRGR